MVRKTLVFNDTFWKCLTAIENLEEVSDISTFCSQGSFDEGTVFEAVEFLADLGIKVDLVEGEVNTCIKPLSEVGIECKFKLTEWIALQAHFPLLEKYSGKQFHESVKNKFSELENQFPQFDIYNNEDYPVEMSSLDKECKTVMTTLSKMKNDRGVCKLSFKDKKEISLYLHRVVFLDGNLKVVGEDTNDKCLLILDVENIKEVEVLENEDYSSRYSAIEIVDFLDAFRAVSGKEVRAIFKIKDFYDIHVDFEHQFLSNPHVTSGADGSTIWAVGIEICPELFEWMFSLDDKLEILDPEELKVEYEQFCLEKASGITKKAS